MSRRPPCPDPDRYIWVNSEGGGYWRLKRGRRTKADVNESLSKNARLTKPVNGAGSLILSMLEPYTKDLKLGRAYSHLTGKLKKGINQSGVMDYSFLKDFDLQKRPRLAWLLTGGFSVHESPGLVEVRIPIFSKTIKNTGRLVTHYFFDLVLVEGDALNTEEMRIDSDTSEVFSREFGGFSECRLSVHPTRTPWMVLLKLNSIETPTERTTEGAVSPSNYGMQVVAVSGR